MVIETARKLVVFIVGMTVVLIGVVMIVAPGPAVVVIPTGLAILGTEFVWARRLLKKLKDKGKQAFEAMGIGGNDKPAQSHESGSEKGSLK